MLRVALTTHKQDIYQQDAGAFTGAVAGSMVRSVGARYVLVGHSERRALFGDSDADVAKKLRCVTTLLVYCLYST
jgi:triosephosphate isomerase (TIM)